MTFGQALTALKSGLRVTRAGWNGRGMWLELQRPGSDGHFGPHIYMRTADGHFVPWIASQTDMLAEDWAIVYHGVPIPIDVLRAA